MKSRLFLLGLILALVLSASACGGGGPSATVKAFYQAVEAGKIDKAVSLFSDQVISMLGADMIASAILAQKDSIDASGGLKDLKITDEQVDGDTAVVSVERTMGDGSVSNDNVMLIKEDGKWKINLTK